MSISERSWSLPLSLYCYLNMCRRGLRVGVLSGPGHCPRYKRPRPVKSGNLAGFFLPLEESNAADAAAHNPIGQRASSPRAVSMDSLHASSPLVVSVGSVLTSSSRAVGMGDVRIS